MITAENAHLITHNKVGEPVRIIATDLNHSTYQIAVERCSDGSIHSCSTMGSYYADSSSNRDLDLTPIMPPPTLEVGKSYMCGSTRFKIVHHFPEPNTFVGCNIHDSTVKIFQPSGISMGGMFQLDPRKPL